MKPSKFENLNKDIIREIIIGIKTYETKQKIDIEQAPYQTEFRGLRSKQLLQKLNDNRKETNSESFSPNTFNKYMKVLTKEGWIKRHAESHRTVIYELNAEKMKEAEKALQEVDVSGNTLSELANLTNNLSSYWADKPFFGLVGTDLEEKVNKLIYIRDTCRKIANELDLLYLPEVRA